MYSTCIEIVLAPRARPPFSASSIALRMWGQTNCMQDQTNTKKVIFHPKMMPRVVIIDPELAVGMPPAILKRIHAAAIAALNSAELLEQYGKVSGVPMPSSPEEFGVFLAQDQAKWSKVIKDAKIKLE